MDEKDKYKFYSIPADMEPKENYILGNSSTNAKVSAEHYSDLQKEVAKLVAEDTDRLLTETMASELTPGYTYTDRTSGCTHVVSGMAEPSALSATFDINWMTSSYFETTLNLTEHLDKINNQMLKNTLKCAQTLLYCNHEMMSRANVSKIALYS